MGLNISQDLKMDFSYRSRRSLRYDPVVEFFTKRDESNPLGQRVLTAITWYNRSVRMDIDEETSLVNLAIAFESLLDLEQGEKITHRFKEAVSLLLGKFPRLDSWLIQFYKARSEIVHEGKSQHLMFMATNKPDNSSDNLIYRSLISYGREIFQACVATILTGARISDQLQLSSKMVTNQQRFDQICQTLCNGEGTADERMLAVSQYVYEIGEYRFVPENGLNINQLIGTTKLLIQNFLETKPDVPSEVIVKMKDLTETKSSELYTCLRLVKEISEGFEGMPSVSTTSPPNHLAIVKSLLESVWHYTFWNYFQLEKQQSKKQ